MNGKRKCSVCVYIFFVAVQLLSHIQLFMIPWTAARQACLSPSPRVCPSLCSLHQWCHPAISSSDALFSCPRSFPALGTSPVSHLFTSDDWNTGVSASASVLPMCIQGWFPLSLTGLISLLSKGLSGVFSSINSSALLLSGPALTTVCHHWADHRRHYTELHWQSNVSAFQHTV